MAKEATKSKSEGSSSTNPFEPEVPMASGPDPFQAHVAATVDPSKPAPKKAEPQFDEDSEEVTS